MLRLFIAIPIPEDIKDSISRIIQKIILKNAKFVLPENWHFTLTFLGNQNEKEIPNIQNAINETKAQITEKNTIEIEKITYGPPGQTPRMIWVVSDKKTNNTLGKIKSSLEAALESFGVIWKKDNYPFQGHITIARFNPTPVNNLPRIEKNLNYRFNITSIDLMQSTLTRQRAIYNKVSI